MRGRKNPQKKPRKTLLQRLRRKAKRPQHSNWDGGVHPRHHGRARRRGLVPGTPPGPPRRMPSGPGTLPPPCPSDHSS